MNFTQNVIISRFRVDSINFKFNAICIKFAWTDEIQGGPWAEKRREKEKNWQKAWRSDHKTKKRANLLFLPPGNLQLLSGNSSIIRSTPYFSEVQILFHFLTNFLKIQSMLLIRYWRKSSVRNAYWYNLIRDLFIIMNISNRLKKFIFGIFFRV